MKKEERLVYLLLFLILFFGLCLRVYNLENVPPGIYPDEAINGEDAIRANQAGNYQWFYPSNQGREGLFINLIALCFKLFGINTLTLKLPAILFSTLTIWGVFLLVKQLFKNNHLALIGAFLVATSFWSINFGRISFRANMLPFVLVFSFYFLFRGLESRKKIDFILGGIFFGLGIHTYIAWRISPLILILLFLFLLYFQKNFFKQFWKGALIFNLCALFIALPMFYTFFAHPQYFESRSDSLSIFSPKVNQGNFLGTFLRSFSLSLQKYNFWGDQNWRHNYPPYPLLDPVTGIAFLFGIIIAFGTLLKKLYLRIKEKIRDEELGKYTLLFLWFFIMLAPEFLTSEGLPHALRSIGTLPVVFIFSVLTFNFLIEKSKKHGIFFRKSVSFLIIFTLLGIGVFNTLKYHYFWARKVEVANSFNKNLTDISRYLKTLPEAKEKFIITGYNTLARLPIYIFNPDSANTRYLYPHELDKISPRDPKNLIVISTEKNPEFFSALMQKFPQLSLKEIKNSLNSNFYVLK